MDRFVLTDAQWAKMESHCLGKPSDPGWSGSNNRRSSRYNYFFSKEEAFLACVRWSNARDLRSGGGGRSALSFRLDWRVEG
jgi:hypothetical protein